MALIGPPGFDVARMRREVRDTYERLAADPTSVGHLNHGASYATTLLGYDAAELAALPSSTTGAFVGVANPHRLGAPDPDATVLDIGCGTGTDLLLTARRLGAGGRVIGVDPTPTMRMRAREGARALGLAPRVDVRPGLAEELPLGSSSVDLVQTNGVLNLVVDKVRAFSEIHRVLKPGGRLHLADVLLHHDLHEHERMEPRLWAAWIAGALPEAELLTLLAALGFEDIELTERFDCFAGTSVSAEVHPKVGPHGANVRARKR